MTEQHLDATTKLFYLLILSSDNELSSGRQLQSSRGPCIVIGIEQSHMYTWLFAVSMRETPSGRKLGPGRSGGIRAND